jgi:hypothetical protein
MRPYDYGMVVIGAGIAGLCEFLAAGIAHRSTIECANETAAQYICNQTRAEPLSPRDHPYGTKPAVMDTGCCDTFDRADLTLADARSPPIGEITTRPPFVRSTVAMS